MINSISFSNNETLLVSAGTVIASIVHYPCKIKESQIEKNVNEVSNGMYKCDKIIFPNTN